VDMSRRKWKGKIKISGGVVCFWWRPNTIQKVASSPGHSQILSHSCKLDEIWEWPGDEATQKAE